MTKTRRKKYQRKREQPPSEKEVDLLKQVRQAEYESALSKDGVNKTSINRGNNNFWAFERLFPEPVWDDATIQRDLYEVSDRDKKLKNLNTAKEESPSSSWKETIKMRTLSPESRFMSSVKQNLKVFHPPSIQTNTPYNPPSQTSSIVNTPFQDKTENSTNSMKSSPLSLTEGDTSKKSRRIVPGINLEEMVASTVQSSSAKIDRALTRLVEERMYGYRRTLQGDYVYETSLMGDGAVKFRDGKRLGNPLQVNIDLLNYHAKRELKHGRLEEAEEIYERAMAMDPKDGRAYLGLSKIAERRRDFAYAKECLKMGISRSVSFLESGNPNDSSGKKSGGNSLISPTGSKAGFNIPDNGANPFLLQALGSLEEQLGHLTEAEALYVEATKSRPSHAAAWVSLAELRTKKLRQGPNAGRLCFQRAERELKLARLPQSAYVYTAWASLEYKAGDIRKARELFQSALDLDPRCSSAWLQLGVLEANKENWTKAKECFETVLTFDQRNSRVIQAYAIMESKRPDGDSREVIELFERALAMNPRDGGVYQAYGLYVAKLGDINGARSL
jgi:tetratricopeptide (TPR) repeat protein